MVLKYSQQTPGPTYRYNDEEVGEIQAEAHGAASLEELHCPRDHRQLRVFFAEFRPVPPGQPTRGVLHGEWGDVTVISVACPSCQGGRPRISLLRD
ncbi:MAG: hypothetical protein HY700_21860 [Gemmatimonadetes bacterium]|nr:hypothetical protein [Gemmatimonadota bacterium]